MSYGNSGRKRARGSTIFSKSVILEVKDSSFRAGGQDGGYESLRFDDTSVADDKDTSKRICFRHFPLGRWIDRWQGMDSWRPQSMNKPARRAAMAIGLTDSSELESRRLMSADLPEFAAVIAASSRPEMPAHTIEPSQIRFVGITQFSEKTDLAMPSKPAGIVPVSIAFRTIRPEYAAFRQISRGPAHFQTSLGDPLDIKFGSPLKGNADISGGHAMNSDPAGSNASMPSLSGDIDHSDLPGLALKWASSSTPNHVIIRLRTFVDEILTRAFEMASDRNMQGSAKQVSISTTFPFAESAANTFDTDSIAPAPAFIAQPNCVVAAPSIETSALEPVSGQSQRNATIGISADSQPIESGPAAQPSDFRAGDRESSGESGEAPLLGAVARSETPRPGPFIEHREPDAAPVADAKSRDDIWSRISEAFDLEDTDFEPIGEPLDDSVEIDENELSAAVDRVIEGFAIPLEDSYGSPRIGATIGLAAGTAITVGLVLRRRRDAENRNGQRGRFEIDRTTQVRPHLDANDAGR